jgi:hypothetical protein
MAETAKRASTDTVENGPFEMASLKKTKAPAGTEGGNWYKYIINQGANRIVGYRQGSLAAVTKRQARAGPSDPAIPPQEINLGPR